MITPCACVAKGINASKIIAGSRRIEFDFFIFIGFEILQFRDVWIG
jgi:hypothetical protein